MAIYQGVPTIIEYGECVYASIPLSFHEPMNICFYIYDDEPHSPPEWTYRMYGPEYPVSFVAKLRRIDNNCAWLDSVDVDFLSVSPSYAHKEAAWTEVPIKSDIEIGREE